MEVWLRTPRGCSVYHLLCAIEQKHKVALYQSFLDHVFEYCSCTMTITFVCSVCAFHSLGNIIEQERGPLVSHESDALEIGGLHGLDFSFPPRNIYAQSNSEQHFRIRPSQVAAC